MVLSTLISLLANAGKKTFSQEQILVSWIAQLQILPRFVFVCLFVHSVMRTTSVENRTMVGITSKILLFLPSVNAVSLHRFVLCLTFCPSVRVQRQFITLSRAGKTILATRAHPAKEGHGCLTGLLNFSLQCETFFFSFLFFSFPCRGCLLNNPSKVTQPFIVAVAYQWAEMSSLKLLFPFEDKAAHSPY